VWHILPRRLVKHETGQVGQLVYEVKQLADVICDRRGVGVDLFEIFLKNFTGAFEAIIHRLVVGVRAPLWLLARLDQQDSVRH